MMKRLILALLLVLAPAIAFAQQGGGVVVFPPITPGDCASWKALNILQDSGGACGGGGGSGTVTSVGLALPSSILTVSGSPVTTTGTLTGTLATQTANTVFSGPTTGSAATPTFRALTAADLPAGTGTLTSITGGTGILPSTNPCTTTCTLNTTVTNNAQTGATYAVLATDGGKIVSASNSSSEAYSIAAANTTGFTAGFGFDLNNIGAGTTTLTATTSLFDNGLTTLALVKGQDAYIYSDGANYHSIVSVPILAADNILGNFSGTTNYPIAGALTSCSGASNAVTYNTTTHAFGCNTISGGGSGTVNTGTTPDIAYYATSTTAVSDGGAANVQTGALIITTACGATGACFGLPATSDISFYTGGTRRWTFTSGTFQGFISGSASIQNVASSATVPTLNPSGGTTSGIGGVTNVPAMIVSGATIENWASTGPTIAVIPSDTGLTDASLCRVTATGAVDIGTGTAGICLGTVSSEVFKTNIVTVREGLPEILALKPKNFFYRKGFGDNGAKEQYGFLAEDYAKVLPKLTRRDARGHPNGVDMLGAVPVLVRSIQEMQREITSLGQAALDDLKREVLLLFIWNALLTAWLLAITLGKGKKGL